jgi:hypothetical protein
MNRPAISSRPLRLLVLVVLVALSGLVHPAPAYAETTNGPVLTTQWPTALRNLDGSVVAELRNWEISKQTRFSPTGDRIAYVRYDVETDESVVVVQHHEGDVDEYGPFTESVEQLDWSPDGSQLVLLMSAGFQADTLARLPLTATDPVPVVSDSAAFDVDRFSEVSWGTNGLIVFVGGEPEPGGFFQAVHAQQLYTVPATGGAPSRFNVHLPEDGCTEDEEACYYSFQHPEWSPNGSSVVVEVEKSPYEGNTTRYLSVVTSGVTHPSSRTALRAPHLGISYFNGPQWSPDGATILFQDDDGGGFYSATLTGGSRTRLPDSLDWMTDWQPCENGVCLPWGQAVDKVPTTISLNLASGAKIRVNGQVNPNKAGQKVTLTLKKQVKGVWKKVSATKPTLSAKSRYVVSFKRPSGQMCMVTARYPGDATHAPSSRQVQFFC